MGIEYLNTEPNNALLNIVFAHPALYEIQRELNLFNFNVVNFNILIYL